MAENLSDHLVFLVHGTWGRGVLPFFRSINAPWCEVDSALRKSISSALGENTQYRVFNWSGANTPGARLRAAKSLGELLVETRKQRPTSKIHLVAHSHGGNIVLYALSNSDVSKFISSSVFLSTPFLHITPRNLGLRLGQRIQVLAVLSAIYIGFIIAYLFTVQTLSPVSCCVWLFFVVAMMAFLPYSLRRLHSWSHSFAKRMVLPEKLPFPVLIIRGSADEAASALGGAQFFSTLLTKVLRLLIMSFPPLDREPGLSSSLSQDKFIKIYALIIATGVLVFLIWRVFASLSAPGLEGFLAVLGMLGFWLPLAMVAIIFIFPLFILFVVPLLVLLITFMVLLAALPFGAKNMLAAIGMHISAEATPPGKWSVVQLAPNSVSFEEDGGLSHFTHSNAEALREIESWLS